MPLLATAGARAVPARATKQCTETDTRLCVDDPGVKGQCDKREAEREKQGQDQQLRHVNLQRKVFV